MKKNYLLLFTLTIFTNFFLDNLSIGQTVVKKGAKYDTIIRKHVTKPRVKPVVKTTATKSVDTVKVLVIPTPEFINQPYFYDSSHNSLIKLENSTAQLVTKKKAFGLQGSKQFFNLDGTSSKIRFTASNNINFIIKTSGDVIDLTSYVKLYEFVPEDQKRIVTINAKEGLLTDKDDAKGKLVPFSVKMISPDNYLIQLANQLDAGEYGFVWIKNMELKEFNVFAFGIDWKSSN